MNIVVLSKDERSQLQEKFGLHHIGDFYDDVAVAQYGNQWFHVAKDGTPLYSKRYCRTEFFQDGGLAWVKESNGAWITINIKGEVVDRKVASSL